jgi:hypothetical protein
MSTNIKLKRSAVSGRIPATGDLALGELAINTYDGKLFMKKNDGTESIVDITSGGGGGAAYTTGSEALTTTSIDQIVDTFSKVTYRTVKYYVELSTASAYQATELFLTHDGTSVYITEYATVTSGSSLGTINSDISGDNVRLLVTPVNTNTTVKFARIEVASTGGGGGGGGGASTLAGLSDVDVTTVAPTNGQVLKYNTTSSKWEPGDDNDSGGGGGSSTTLEQGNFSTSGDAITREYVLRGTTTNATETELFYNTSDRIPVGANTTVYYTVDIVARRTDATGEGAAFQLKGIADNFSGTVADIGLIYEVIVARDDSNYSVDAGADDTNDAIYVKVTGVAAKTIRWVAYVRTVEVAQ